MEPFHEFITRRGVASALLCWPSSSSTSGDSLCTALATPSTWTWLFQERDRRDRQERRAVPAVIARHAGRAVDGAVGINRALWLFGVVQLASIFGLPGWLAGAAPSDPRRLSALALVIGFEALGVGLGTAAFVATSHAPPPVLHGHAAGVVHQPGGGAAHLHQCQCRLVRGCPGLVRLLPDVCRCWRCRACCSCPRGALERRHG